MPSIRTLENIVNSDLNTFLSEKFKYAKSMGVEIEIELTEPIDNLIIDTDGFLKIMNRLLEDALQTIKEFDEKKMLFCMFYNNDDLWCIVRHRIIINDVEDFRFDEYNKKLNKLTYGYEMICNIEYEKPDLTQLLIFMK